VLAGRFGHWRALMIAADPGRAALLASIPACYAVGVLTIWPLYAVAVGFGTLNVLFTVCQPAPVTVPPAIQFPDHGPAAEQASHAPAAAAGEPAG